MEFTVQVSLSSIFFVLLIATGTKGASESLIGDQCEVDKNCVTPQTVCSNGGVCECLTGQYSSDDRRSCIATPNALCFDDTDCRSLPSSTCFLQEALDGVCMCNDGYSASEDTKICLADASYQGSCTQPSQCTTTLGTHGTCKDSKCDCEVDYHFSSIDGICIKDVGLLGSCQNTSVCVLSESKTSNQVFCNEGTCSCINGFVAFEGTCRAGAERLVVCITTLFLYWIIKLVIT